jgi:hypothetical protein
VKFSLDYAGETFPYSEYEDVANEVILSESELINVAPVERSDERVVDVASRGEKRKSPDLHEDSVLKHNSSTEQSKFELLPRIRNLT